MTYANVRRFAVISLFVALSCIHKVSTKPDIAAPPMAKAPAPAISCGSNGVAPSLTCPQLPNTSAAGVWVDNTGTPLATQPTSQPGQAQTTPNAYLDYDLWAWNSFIAMNWPALDPAVNDNPRGFPDPNQSFATAQSTDTLVWETYKEKREVFLINYKTGQPSTQTPLPWNSPPQYGPSDSQVPCCPGKVCDLAVNRDLGSQSKLFFDTLDETAEVASEALETQSALCGGWVANPATQCSTSNNPCCTLNGHPVGPRVWRGNPYPGPATPVVYEVKINYDSFNYITDPNRKYYFVNNARTAATGGKIALPARTSGTTMPPQPGQQGSPFGFNKGPAGYSASTCNGMSNAPGSTPCSAGAVHLKAAWMQLQNGDDPSTYHTARAYQYVTNTNVSGNVCKSPATFGLIGLHIIQRVHENTQPHHPALGAQTSSGQPRGGTYVFASWEHLKNDSLGFTYANFSGYTPNDEPNAPLLPYPNVNSNTPAGAALPLNRVYPILPSTARANTLIHGMLNCPASGSVWCNYQLIGTQYAATSTPSPAPAQLSALTPQSANIEAPSNSGQPYYLANLVVESNVGLQQFQGLPPTSPPPPAQPVVTVISNYSQYNPTNQFTSSFQRSAENLAYRTQKNTSQYTMGGCMGCHGVAQLSGYSFSFVLLDNQYGGIPDTQKAFSIPPTDPPSD